MEGHPLYHEHRCGEDPMCFSWQVMDVEEEIKMLEEYREALAKTLEKVNKRLEALKRENANSSSLSLKRL
jgi:tetrahydromethanopterin S-methyltransferase subunit B